MYKISANIVCNNEKHWIKESILSIVNLVDEIIFVDDRSTDGTLEIVKDLSKTHSNIKIFDYESVDGILGIRTRDCKIADTEKSTGLWRPPFQGKLRTCMLNLDC